MPATVSNSRSAALLACGALLIASAWASRAHADNGLCALGTRCMATAADANADAERHLAELTADIQVSHAAGNSRQSALSSQEYFSFSGVGAIVCTINGKQHTSTAFLVGAFDIGVTVAHTFEENGHWTKPANCVYTSTDSLGQIRERIPVSDIKAQWQNEAGAFGQPAKDFAVVRLSEPSNYAQRTMPLGKFSGAPASVLMVGFKSDIDADSLKQKTRGTVYGRKASGLTISGTAGFTHDMDSRGIAAGAPVIDEHSGVIIGIHTVSRVPASGDVRQGTRNTMITMNDWLEDTLRAEMQESEQIEAHTSAGKSGGK